MGARTSQTSTASVDTTNRTHVRVTTGREEPSPSQDAVVVDIDGVFHKPFTLGDFDQFIGALQLAGRSAHEAFERRQQEASRGN